jgi:hypothetical protein
VLRNCAAGQNQMSGEIAKISVLLDAEEAKRFDAYCKQKGFKKSSLTARLIRDHLNGEQFQCHQRLSDSPTIPPKQKRR